MSKILRGLLATRSLWTSWIKIARYLAYRVEIESSTSLKPPYYITRTSSLRIWMKNVYRLLCCSTCLKLSTASNTTTYYQNCTYWVCWPPLSPGLRVTQPTERITVYIDSGCDPWVHSRSSFVHVIRQEPSFCTEEVQSHGLCWRHQTALTLLPSDISVAISDLNSDLREIAKWWSTNSLLINPNKTKLLVVGNPQLTRNVSFPPVFLLGKNIKPSPVVTDLGLWIDSAVTFDYHVS